MQHIYCLSGLAADEKAFSKLNLKEYDVHFIKWIQPQKNETTEDYAKRLSEQIHHKDPILIGLSFGGMMCIEIAKIISVSAVILISSVKNYKEMPWWMRVSGKLKLNKILPMRPFKIIEPLENYNLGVQTKAEKEMVNAYRRNVDRNYLKWAINVILNWKNTEKPEKLFHIHGSKDRIFKIKNLKADHIIENGGHLMVFNKAEEVSEALKNFLNEKCKMENEEGR